MSCYAGGTVGLLHTMSSNESPPRGSQVMDNTVFSSHQAGHVASFQNSGIEAQYTVFHSSCSRKVRSERGLARHIPTNFLVLYSARRTAQELPRPGREGHLEVAFTRAHGLDHLVMKCAIGTPLRVRTPGPVYSPLVFPSHFSITRTAAASVRSPLIGLTHPF